jgi:Transcriptional regulator PadR-like family
VSRARRWVARRRLQAQQQIVWAMRDYDWHYGLDVMRTTGLRSGRFYPNLDRLMDLGHVEAKWADLEPGRKHRRRLYRLVPARWIAGRLQHVKAEP